jgi:hypothetical protein
MRASGILAVLLCGATVAHAAPAGSRHTHPRRSCSEKSAVHKFPRHVQSSGGPLARPSGHTLAGWIDLHALVKRGVHPTLPDDDEAIQNDVPAARIEIDGRPVPALQPLGVLQGSFDRRPSTHAFSPRSPRGPPTSA